MNRAMRTAATGMVAQQLQVDTIANNIANANTTGFKRNRLAFRALMYQTLREPGAATLGSQANPTGLQIGSGTEVGSSLKVHLQGDLEPTGNPFDVAINGDGFFRVQLANGDFRYTRDGHFRKDADGYLVTPDGYRVNPAVTIPEDTQAITISDDGQVSFITSTSPTPQTGPQLQLYRFPNTAGLKAVGNNLYAESASSGVPDAGNPGNPGFGFVHQGFEERSNVSVVEELIELIQAQRNYEVNSRSIRVADEMMQQAGQLIR
jgi:flagellar basal-body rod protein FlgG